MLAVCPTDPRHDRFVTVAHVAQDWEVDPSGAFLDEVMTTETIAGPDAANTWSCQECGEAATVYRDDAEGERARDAALREIELEELAEMDIDIPTRQRPNGLAERL